MKSTYVQTVAGAQKRKFPGGARSAKLGGWGTGFQKIFSNMAPNKSISDFEGVPGLPGGGARPFWDAGGGARPRPPLILRL